MAQELDLARYRGHLALPGVGVEGQRKLAQSSVLCVGTGGLGSPAALYLAAAGIGRIGLLDADEVDHSNLHRQILFRTADVGAPKAETARKVLAALNPEIELVVHDQRLEAHNATDLLSGYDVVLDGTDNFPTRYLINEACVRLGKPDVWASIFRFEGQLAVFDAKHGPCYRCLFPEVPPDEEIPACAEAGVLGVLPGILGASQALEAMKLLLGLGKPAIGRLLVFDALAFAWTELAVERDPACRTCGSGARIEAPRAVMSDAPDHPPAIAPEDLQHLRADNAVHVLDCREPFEWDIAHLEGSQLIPLGELRDRLDEVSRDRPVVVVCHHGPRSMRAAWQLQKAGFPNVRYLKGGLNLWALRVDSEMPRY
ncbi:MAG TPA: molybdopterin-synthase adenylyltransferase MoeB [Oscillatoriaceae cyanobacterium]